MQRRHIRYARWLKWLCQLTYEFGRNTEGGAGEHSTKERKEYVVLRKTLETWKFQTKMCSHIGEAHTFVWKD